MISDGVRQAGRIMIYCQGTGTQVVTSACSKKDAKQKTKQNPILRLEHLYFLCGGLSTLWVASTGPDLWVYEKA